MAKLFIPAYWPFFTGEEIRTFHYTDATGSLKPATSTFRYDKATDSMLYDDYDENGKWKDRWYYQYRPGLGVSEWRDDMVMPSTWKWLFGDTKKVVMNPPIGWGEYLDVGEVYNSFPKMVPWKCLPWEFSSGVNQVTVIEHIDTFVASGVTYNDVVKLFFRQSWDGGDTVAAFYYMAFGMGPVAIEWVSIPADGPVGVSPILEATITHS